MDSSSSCQFLGASSSFVVGISADTAREGAGVTAAGGCDGVGETVATVAGALHAARIDSKTSADTGFMGVLTEGIIPEA